VLEENPTFCHFYMYSTTFQGFSEQYSPRNVSQWLFLFSSASHGSSGLGRADSAHPGRNQVICLVPRTREARRMLLLSLTNCLSLHNTLGPYVSLIVFSYCSIDRSYVRALLLLVTVMYHQSDHMETRTLGRSCRRDYPGARRLKGYCTRTRDVWLRGRCMCKEED
jgi:hypothetical protein